MLDLVDVVIIIVIFIFIDVGVVGNFFVCVVVVRYVEMR